MKVSSSTYVTACLLVMTIGMRYGVCCFQNHEVDKTVVPNFLSGSAPAKSMHIRMQ